ncbi:hypothetical protein IVB45_23005 [Bradyrhizobium sp. 4]|uniref:hypothetical protein n=1 Tax=unclassified Bradyrhizobium TaxID=2631580 RepID=UPI001FFBDA05|nr:MULTISPECIES: hypothetical protein [unclassified Bradyrhizobium]MCK1402768.1 hypothetical protein [Bradyrhizobium sp. 39]MCK1748363.1 hypothetical protein [Bradyrhizobium sp. 135]UPJ32836.1 hypothetical protein IVB45_23005 [Bradyrhizobium sp. 4]
MTIASQLSRISYNGDGSTTVFPIPFYFQANVDIVVNQLSPTNFSTLQVLGSDYTLTGATVSTGGACTFVTAPASGYRVTIYRDPPATQTASYNNNDPFAAKSHEGALDKLTTLCQRLKDRLGRALTLPESSTFTGLTLPDPEAGKYLKWKADDSGLENTSDVTFPPNSYPIATQSEAEAGAQNVVLMTPLRTSQYVTSTLASQAEAEAGALSDVLMTPLRTAQAITAKAERVFYETYALAAAATIPSTATYIITAGYFAAGDGGGSIATNAIYKRVGSLPAHAGYIHSADGAYWELTGSRVSVRQFGAVPVVSNLDTDPDSAAAINLCMAYCNLKHTNMTIPSGQWALDSAITSPTFIIEISGCQGGGQPTILYKRYVEVNANKGVISLGAWGATITDIQIAAGSSASGGSGLSAILPNNAANIGILRVRNFYVSCGNGVANSLNINGTNNTGGVGGTGGKSYRSAFFENCHFFGAAQYSVLLLSVQHCFASNVYSDPTGGSTASGYTLNCAGSANAPNDDIYWTGIIGGSLSLDRTSRASFNSVVTGNVDNTANVSSTTVMRCLGAVGSNWTGSRAIN